MPKFTVRELLELKGMRAVGRNAKQAAQDYRDGKAFEAAGAFALEIEVVSTQVVAMVIDRIVQGAFRRENQK